MILSNKTPFVADTSILPGLDGSDELHVFVKASFNTRRGPVLADEQVPLAMEDEYFDDPKRSSLAKVSEYSLGKVGTDIAVIGSAFAPNDKPAVTSEVNINVASIKKSLHIFGDRFWTRGAISAPERYLTMPIIYERAYGGSVELHGKTCYEARNPIGVGYSQSCSGDMVEGQQLPNIEAVGGLIRGLGDVVTPAGLGFIPAHWAPRIDYAGTYDQNWEKERAPILPADFDLRFNSCASPGLIVNGFIQGGEPVRVENMSASGLWEFKLPVVNLECEVVFRRQLQKLVMNVDFLVLEPDLSHFTMTWHGSIKIGEDINEIDSVQIALLKSAK